MQSVAVARLKKGMCEVDQLTNWSFAGVYGRDCPPPELLSQLVTFRFKHYIREEFMEVVQEAITGQLAKDPDLARYVSERVVLRVANVCPVIQLAKLCD